MTTMPTNAVRPKLSVASAARAIAFYRQTLGATEVVRYADGDRVVLAEIDVLGTRVTLKDADEHDPAPGPDRPGPILDVVTDTPDAYADRMAAAGAEVVFPVQDQPYGARGGRVRDPFGVQWLLQTPVTLGPEELGMAGG